MDLVTIATFDGAGPARLAAARLEAEGIQCQVADEGMAGLRQFYSTDGVVKLRVREGDEETARRVLDESTGEQSRS